METHWVICPLCKAKTRLKLLPDTVLKNYPLFCPKCKEEVIINAEHLQVSVTVIMVLYYVVYFGF